MLRLTQDVEELRSPISDAVSDLKKENESLMRELDRFDHLYKKLFVEYMDALADNKKILTAQQDLEKRLSQSNYINNATI